MTPVDDDASRRMERVGIESDEQYWEDNQDIQPGFQGPETSKLSNEINLIELLLFRITYFIEYSVYFFKENDETLLVHCTWQVVEKGLKIK